jgi:hypothetical protein
MFSICSLGVVDAVIFLLFILGYVNITAFLLYFFGRWVSFSSFPSSLVEIKESYETIPSSEPPSIASDSTTSRMPVINNHCDNTGMNTYYQDCPSAVSYPSQGCSSESPSGDIVMGIGSYAAVGGTPQQADRLGQYSPGSIDLRENGGSNVYYRKYGEFDSKGPLAPGVTLSTC